MQKLLKAKIQYWKKVAKYREIIIYAFDHLEGHSEAFQARLQLDRLLTKGEPKVKKKKKGKGWRTPVKV